MSDTTPAEKRPSSQDTQISHTKPKRGFFSRNKDASTAAHKLKDPDHVAVESKPAHSPQPVSFFSLFRSVFLAFGLSPNLIYQQVLYYVRDRN
jgi:hypothetical protein